MKHYALGMDIGGTNTVFGVVDRDGKVVCSDSVKTRDFSVLDNYIETVSKKILCLMEKVGGKDDVSGLGIGAPNGNLLPATASVFNVSPVTSAKLLEILIE